VVFGCHDHVDYIGTENDDPQEILKRIEYLFGYKIYESGVWHWLMINLANNHFLNDDVETPLKSLR